MIPFQKLTGRAKDAIRQSQELAVERGQYNVSTIHLFTALVLQEEGLVPAILDKLAISTPDLQDHLLDGIDSGGVSTNTEQPPLFQLYVTPELATVFKKSDDIAANLGDKYISTEHLFLSILENPGGVRDVINIFGINVLDVKKLLNDIKKAPSSSVVKEPKNKVIEKFTRNLTEDAKNNKLDPVIGRDKEINRVIQILSRRTKNNPMLIGEAGVGKTAIAEGLAGRIVSNDVPESMASKELLVLDLGLLLAGTKYRGEFEDRLKEFNERNKIK